MEALGQLLGLIFGAAAFFGVSTGLVAAGLIASFWSLAFDESPSFGLLFKPDFLTPLKVPVVVLAAPMIVLSHGAWWLLVQPARGALLIAAGLLWSFVEGVFILTQVFNVT